MVLSKSPSCVGTPRSRTIWFPVKIFPCLYTTRTRSVKTDLSLGLETPKLGIIWFLVSLPLVWERQGREQYGSQLKSFFASIRQGRGQ